MLKNTRFRHPFIDGVELPVGKEKELAKLRAWLKTQPHLPEISDEFCYMFLYGLYYNIDACKRTMEIYFTVRTEHPEIFQNRDCYAPEMQNLLKLANLVHVPKRTPEGYQILFYSLKDPDPTKFIFEDAVKGFGMYHDCVMSEHGLCPGYIIIFDMKGVSYGHLARVAYAPIKAYMMYGQEGHPARLKGVHVLNTVPWIHHVIKVVAPMVRQDYVNLVKFHKGSVIEGFEYQEYLPKDYGGQQETVAELDALTQSMIPKYAEWLKETELYQVDESKRPKKSWWQSMKALAANQMPVDKDTLYKLVAMQLDYNITIN